MSLETKRDDNIELELQLGDVIKITNPANENLDQQTFFIDYIDNFKAYLINTETLNRLKVKIQDDGTFGDGNITNIEILRRADSPSYARQNGLLPGKWINIHFGGDFPVIITGEISNLEEDMIEVKTTDNDMIYINFDYIGIPEDLPIDNIEIREKPSTPLKEPEEAVEENIYMPELEEEKKVLDADKIEFTVPTKDVKEQLREIIVQADKIVFGNEELGYIKEFVDVATKFKRYSIEEQVSDLLDDLLSTIPNSQRTPRVLNNIHIMIERFKQLRENFSLFDNYGNVESVVKKEATYKPLKIWLQNFNKNLFWILPVVKNIKKVYNVENIDEENNDVTNLDIEIDIKDMNKIIENYKTENLPVESNKYASCYSELSNHFIPFKYISDENVNEIIIEKEVNDDINAVIDNLEDFYSSVYSKNMLRNRRFLISKYNIGQSKLDITDSTSSTMNTVRVKITNNELLSIKSIMTLPEPTIRFSKINLPGTDILTRANLNQIFLNYWELLKKKTNVANVFIDTFDKELELDENEFVNGIRNYIMNVPEDEINNLNKHEIYSKYVNSIVPKTKIIFNLMKKYINGKLSIIDIIGYLEPFLIYTDDLTFKQYEEIVEFIDVKISDYNKNMIELSKIFKMLSNIKQMPIIKTKAFSVISIINSKLTDEVFDTGYQLQNPEETFTNSEILRKLILKDYARLYTTTIAYDNIKLMFPKDVSDIFELEKKHNNDKLNDEEKNDKCETIIIAKMYTSLDQLQNDNDAIIYFDKKYDKTNYGIMEESSKKGGYAEQVISLTPENLKIHITRDQMKKNNLNESDATYIAETLINGSKKVIDGQYAILYKGYSENVVDESDYYVRQNNKWVLDKTISKNAGITDEPSIICDLQEKCISVSKPNDDKCESMKTNELTLQNKLLNDIISEFDTKYKVSKEQLEQEIKEQFEYYMYIMPALSKIETNFLLKYNNQRYRLGIEIEDGSKGIVVSPFSQILDIILSQRDIVKKQSDIIKFVDKFTRPGLTTNSSTNESQHWLYCIKTGVPLLPVFKKELAAAFIKSPYQYQYTLEIIKSSIGQLSDDGDWWTDKYTGWPICPGDFDYEEGFDEAGFKVSTRAIIEEDVGNKIMTSTTEQKIQYITPEIIMINNIINALSVAMGINIELQKEFVINSVVDTLKTTVESESDYKEKIKTAKKQMASYKDFFNTSLLYYTLGMFLIAIQTSIPSIKTRKTHPGCVRSFSGYPFEGTGDFSSLTYLSCVTYDIRGPSEPWNVLAKSNIEKIQNRIKAFIDTYLIQLPDVQQKFIEKTEYLLNNPNDEIPKEHDIANWNEFLPPLVPFKIKHLVNISEEFKKSLVNDLKNGSEKQREKILVIESKIIQFSLAIQEKIQQIIKNSKLLLHTSNNEPYLENACCDSKEEQTVINYFTNLSPDIIQFNTIVKKLTNILDDIRSNTESILFYSNINTKNVYPSVSSKFDEKTIYIAFIFYCNFNSLLPIPEDLLPICTDKPETSLINPSDTIDKIIQKLKDDGRNYTNEQFLRLIQLISRENIINIDLDNPVISSVAKLSKLLEAIYDENNEDEMIEQSLMDLISKSIDTFDIAREDYSTEVKKLNDFLIRANEEMTNEIIDYVKLNASSNVTRRSLKSFVETIENLSQWTNDDSTRNEQNKISNEQMYNVNNFYKNYINNFINVFPNIILNKVNYDNINIPSYYGFSKNHSNKLKKYISSYFEKLKQFYGISSITKLLITIQKNGKNILKLAECTPSFSSIKNNEKTLKGVIDERTSRFLFEYYLLRILISYIDLADDNKMIVTEVRKDLDVADIFSVDYIEETETRIDMSIDSRNTKDIRVQTGNKKELKQKTSDLLIAFMDIFSNEKDLINVSYEEIQDRVFKLRETEKDMVTDRLKAMTDEQRDADTMLKITKQGIYSKGLQKGLTIYDKDFYEEEQTLRDEMEKAERKIRKKNKNANDENIDLLVDEYLEQKNIDAGIDEDAYDISGLGETYFDGGFDGVEAPEEEYEDYEQEY
jgi:hypothetical protein